MIFDAPDKEMPENPSVNGIVKPKADAPMTEVVATDTFTIRGEVPTQKQHTCYEDTTGQMRSGTWCSTPFESELKPFPRNEMVHLIEGSVTLIDEDSVEHHFKAGDAFFIPMGTICSWQTTENTWTFYSAFQPSEMTS